MPHQTERRHKPSSLDHHHPSHDPPPEHHRSPLLRRIRVLVRLDQTNHHRRPNHRRHRPLLRRRPLTTQQARVQILENPRRLQPVPGKRQHGEFPRLLDGLCPRGLRLHHLAGTDSPRRGRNRRTPPQHTQSSAPLRLAPGNLLRPRLARDRSDSALGRPPAALPSLQRQRLALRDRHPKRRHPRAKPRNQRRGPDIRLVGRERLPLLRQPHPLRPGPYRASTQVPLANKRPRSPLASRFDDLARRPISLPERLRQRRPGLRLVLQPLDNLGVRRLDRLPSDLPSVPLCP